MQTQADRVIRQAKADRRAVNLSIDSKLIDEARAQKINLSRVLEQALETRLKAERARRWQLENQAAIMHHHQRIERQGMWNKDLISI